MAALLLDITIAVLLAITVGYCWKLSKKLTQLHQGRKELNEFIRHFDHSITKAEKQIGELKYLSEETDGFLIEHINKARFLANDLSFLMDKGENVAETLEHFIAAGQPAPPASRPSQSSLRSASDRPSAMATKRQAEQPSAMQTADRLAAAEPAASNTQAARERKQQALEDVLDIIAKRKAAANAPINGNTTLTPSPAAIERTPQALEPALEPAIAGVIPPEEPPANQERIQRLRHIIDT